MIGFLDWFTFENLIKFVKDSAVAVWDWFVAIVASLLGPFWEPLVGAFAAMSEKFGEASTALSGLVPYLEFANAWAPIDVFFQCLGLYSVFWLALVTYRSVKKWIPTLSG